MKSECEINLNIPIPKTIEGGKLIQTFTEPAGKFNLTNMGNVSTSTNSNIHSYQKVAGEFNGS